MTDYPLPESPNRAHVRRNDIHGHDGENFCDGPIYPASELRALGADIRFGRLVAQFAEKPDDVDCILDDGERIAADNMAGGDSVYRGTYGASVVKVGNLAADGAVFKVLADATFEGDLKRWCAANACQAAGATIRCSYNGITSSNTVRRPEADHQPVI